MKEILTEWRKFLLLERDSDIMYQEITSFFINQVIKNWQQHYNFLSYRESNFNSVFPNVIDTRVWSKKKKERTPMQYPISDTWHQNVLFGLSPKTENINNLYEIFKDYQKKYRQEQSFSQNVPEKEIIKNLQDFNNIFSRIRLLFFSSAERPGAGGDMAPSGIMRIFVPISRSQLREYLSNQQGIEVLKNWITDTIYSDSIVRTISHEFAHFINAFRSNFKPHRTSGSGKNTYDQYFIDKDESHWYANSTEEIQARVTEITQDLIEKIKQGDQQVINLFKNKDFNSFKNDLLKMPRSGGQGTVADELFYDKLSGKKIDTKSHKFPPSPKDVLASLPASSIKNLPSSATAKQNSKLSLSKKQEIKRKVDNRLLDIYNALKTKVS